MKSQPTNSSDARPTLANFWPGVAIFAATLLAYLPAINAGFIWNDSDYVTAPELRSLFGLARIWFEVGATEQYYPMLHSAFWLEHRLWGDSPAGYHLVNIFLHAASACLLAGILRRLEIRGAWLAGFVFALHPVYVESVAWISEQKNTLSLVFYLLAARAYLRFDVTRARRDYVFATVWFVVGLLSKSTTAMLPPALLVMFWWRRGSLSARRDVFPLLLWFVLGAAMGLFSAWVEKKYIGAEGAEFALTGLERFVLAGRIVWFYFAKLVWPANLIFIYPRWAPDASNVLHWTFPVAACALLAGLWALRHRSRAPLAAALFFGGSLFPVLGFLNVFAFMYSFVADHWQYLPSIGIVVLGAVALNRVSAVFGSAARFLPAILVTALGILTFHQSRMYVDMRTFYRTTVQRNPGAWMAQNNLGTLLREKGELGEAVEHLEAALRVRPDLFKAHYNLASSRHDLKQLAEAERHYRRALELYPLYADAHNHLGRLLRETRRTDEAIGHLLTAIQLNPEYHDARNNLGMALRDAGRPAEAIVQFERVIRARPDFAPAHLNLALSLSLVGRNAEAMEHYREARRLNPAIPELPAR